MKKLPLSPEEEAELTLSSLDGIGRAAVPPGLEERLFSRVKAARPPKWAWAAALAVVLINAGVAWTCLKASPAPPAATADNATTFFSGGTSWY
jgi:hypothetical protein